MCYQSVRISCGRIHRRYYRAFNRFISTQYVIILSCEINGATSIRDYGCDRVTVNGNHWRGSTGIRCSSATGAHTRFNGFACIIGLRRCHWIERHNLWWVMTQISSIIALFIFVSFILTDILRTIRDPEKPNTLEDLNVVYEDGVFVQAPTSDNVQVVSYGNYNSLITYHKSSLNILSFYLGRSASNSIQQCRIVHWLRWLACAFASKSNATFRINWSWTSTSRKAPTPQKTRVSHDDCCIPYFYVLTFCFVCCFFCSALFQSTNKSTTKNVLRPRWKIPISEIWWRIV